MERSGVECAASAHSPGVCPFARHQSSPLIRNKHTKRNQEGDNFLYQECDCLEGYVRELPSPGSPDQTACYADLDNTKLHPLKPVGLEPEPDTAA